MAIYSEEIDPNIKMWEKQNQYNKYFKVVLEIEAIDAKSALEAAMKVESMIANEGGFQYYVQDEKTNEIFSVDLSEENDDAVLPVKNYQPMIK